MTPKYRQVSPPKIQLHNLWKLTLTDPKKSSAALASLSRSLQLGILHAGKRPFFYYSNSLDADKRPCSVYGCPLGPKTLIKVIVPCMDVRTTLTLITALVSLFQLQP